MSLGFFLLEDMPKSPWKKCRRRSPLHRRKSSDRDRDRHLLQSVISELVGSTWKEEKSLEWILIIYVLEESPSMESSTMDVSESSDSTEHVMRKGYRVVSCLLLINRRMRQLSWCDTYQIAVVFDFSVPFPAFVTIRDDWFAIIYNIPIDRYP